jgi:DNA ligase 1
LIDSALQTTIKKQKKYIRKKEFQMGNTNNNEKGVDEFNIDFILYGELIAFKNDKPLHFQELQKRPGKKSCQKNL